MQKGSPEIIEPVDPRKVLRVQAQINDLTAGNSVKDTEWIEDLTPEKAQEIIEAMAEIRKAAGFG